MARQPASDGAASNGQRRSHRLIPALAATVAATLTIGVVAASGGGAAGAASATSSSTGRFLSGEAGGTNFDTVLALNGEKAKYPGNPGPNQNDLSGSVLGMAVGGPTKNIGIPFPGGITLGAVGQYARADQDGTALGSSGLIGSNGAINVSGSGNDNFATINLADLPGASTLTDALGNIKATIGAVSASAMQPALGKAQKDPSASCTSGTYERVSSQHQAGDYQFANVKLDVTSPALATLGDALTTALGTASDNLKTLFQDLPGSVITVSGLPSKSDFNDDLSVNIFDGGVTASLADGSLHVDLAKILKYLKLDLNNLCPNTSLLPYLTKALDKLPAALASLVTGLSDKLNDSLGKVTVTIAGQKQSLTTLTTAAAPVIKMLSDALGTGADALTSALQPIIDALTNDLLDIVVNGQQQSGKTFTETAVQLKLLPAGSSIPTLPGLPTTIPGLPDLSGGIGSLPAPVQTTLCTIAPQLPGCPVSTPQSKKSSSSAKKSSAKAPAESTKSSTKSSGTSSGTSGSKAGAKTVVQPTTAASSSSKPGLLGVDAYAATRLTTGRYAAAAAAADPALELNLAQASVTASSITVDSAAAATAPTGTSLPTGVPAGQASHVNGATPPTALAVLALLSLMIVSGGVFAYRRRSGFTH